MIQSVYQRRRVARWLGLDAVVELPFTVGVAHMGPEEFIGHYLHRGLAPATVVVGEDFRYGHGRAGTLETLRDDLARERRSLVVVPKVLDAQGSKLGSSAIRGFLSEGEVQRAAAVLGRHHTLEGPVIAGARRGRTLGFPTANILSDGAMPPRRGVYASRVQITDPRHPLFGRCFDGVTNVGVHPTFDNSTHPTTGVEVHLLGDGVGDLYGHRVEIAFVARLRDEQAFPNAEALVSQIQQDIADARRLLAHADEHPLAPPHPDDLRGVP